MIFFIFVLCHFVGFLEADEISLKLPGIRPTEEDQYFCHSLNLSNTTYYITEFLPQIDGSHIHHCLLFGTTKPDSEKEAWNCLSSPITTMIFSWSMEASGTKLPKDISFKVGKGTDIQYLVVQAHYKSIDVFKKNESLKDYSGFILRVQKQPTKKLAFYLLMLTSGYIPAHSTVYMDLSYLYKEKYVLHPFSFRVHTHKRGLLVSGYIVHNKRWTEIGRMSPQDQQTYYNITKDIPIINGDILAARCIIRNDGNETVNVGYRTEDEMCNFCLWVWMRADKYDEFLKKNIYMPFSEGYPKSSWNNTFDSKDIPEEASTIPGQKEPIRESIKRSLLF